MIWPQEDVTCASSAMLLHAGAQLGSGHVLAERALSEAGASNQLNVQDDLVHEQALPQQGAPDHPAADRALPDVDVPGHPVCECALPQQGVPDPLVSDCALQPVVPDHSIDDRALPQLSVSDHLADERSLPQLAVPATCPSFVGQTPGAPECVLKVLCKLSGDRREGAIRKLREISSVKIDDVNEMVASIRTDDFLEYLAFLSELADVEAAGDTETATMSQVVHKPKQKQPRKKR